MKTYKVQIDDYNTIRWHNEAGHIHREDGPAVERANGDKLWYQNGLFHRENGPAVEHNNGNKFWYLNGKELTEAEFNKKMQKNSSCAGKVVEIDGKKYKLQEV